MQRKVMYTNPSKSAAIICLVICVLFKSGSPSEASGEKKYRIFQLDNVMYFLFI